ncbi:Zinc finger, TFIIB-type domain protein [Thermoproteus uzoniensis 768-20]|uniref:Zinc finger, TFIIB-type domain protein n=1 Tax=Thermoproteus uzoniensis (strain 768-20) TaxID=999630 RepID=F2L526_THEU7|nr:zinc ribbon domain-containing protein [Thermoproteus uzoniensis]AEA12275.1 Zinc finger, TFIIB-type domain protein [Thermoproteus uzoniensis 768-20]
MKVRCPYCGAEYEAPEGAQYLVCPYCGTVLRQGQVYEKVYVFKASLDKTDAFKRALSLRPWASPEDLASSASLTSAELHFLPLYLYYVYFEPLKELATYATALAVEKPPFYVPRDYRFPARWRIPFKPSLERTAVFHQPQLDPETAWAAASKPYEKEARSYAAAFKKPISDKTTFEGIVYYPFWRLRYAYGGKEYEAVVDAAEGDVVYMEYPVSRTGRGTSAAIALSIVLGAALLGLFGAAVSPAAFVAVHNQRLLETVALAGLAGGGVAGLISASKLLAFTVERKAIYRSDRDVELV